LIRSKTLKNSRKQSGVGAFEVAIGSFMLIAMVAIALDATIFVLAFTRLDQTTRDACRAAAGQPKTSADAAYPSTTCAGALLAAQTQLAQHHNDGVFIKQPTLTGTTAPYFVYQDWGGYVPGPPTANQSPYVTVTCSVQVLLPVPVNFFGFTANGFMQSGNMLTFSRAYTYPIVKTKGYVPPLASG
jgi:Flp pilus assembly protein TadG